MRAHCAISIRGRGFHHTFQSAELRARRDGRLSRCLQRGFSKVGSKSLAPVAKMERKLSSFVRCHRSDRSICPYTELAVDRAAFRLVRPCRMVLPIRSWRVALVAELRAGSTLPRQGAIVPRSSSGFPHKSAHQQSPKVLQVNDERRLFPYR